MAWPGHMPDCSENQPSGIEKLVMPLTENSLGVLCGRGARCWCWQLIQLDDLDNNQVGWRGQSGMTMTAGSEIFAQRLTLGAMKARRRGLRLTLDGGVGDLAHDGRGEGEGATTDGDGEA